VRRQRGLFAAKGSMAEMKRQSRLFRSKNGERLIVQPHCLMFFVDETGDETFADPQYPVFGLGGCALLAAAIEPVLRTPWRNMKALHFGGADLPLHASDLRSPTATQLEALGTFFRNQTFGRFAVTMTRSDLPSDIEPMRIMPRLVRRRWEELTPRFDPLPVEVAFIHEASDRGDVLLKNTSESRWSRSMGSRCQPAMGSCRRATRRWKSPTSLSKRPADRPAAVFGRILRYVAISR